MCIIQSRMSPDGLAIIRASTQGDQSWRHWLIDPNRREPLPEGLVVAKAHPAYGRLLDFPWETIREEYPFEGVRRESFAREVVCRTSNFISGFLDLNLSIDWKDEIASAVEDLLNEDEAVPGRVQIVLSGWPDIPEAVIDDESLWGILDKYKRFSELLDEVIRRQFECSHS